MKTSTITWTATLLALFVATTGQAQKGQGETEGLARQGATPEMEAIAGTLERVKTGPCEHSTGRAQVGTHLLIREDDGRVVNVHVGPSRAVRPFVNSLTTGDALEITAFRTELLPPDQYIAKTIRTDDETYTVRSDDLRPFWADQRGDRRDRRWDRQRDDRRRGDRIRNPDRRRDWDDDDYGREDRPRRR